MRSAEGSDIININLSIERLYFERTALDKNFFLKFKFRTLPTDIGYKGR